MRLWRDKGHSSTTKRVVVLNANSSQGARPFFLPRTMAVCVVCTQKNALVESRTGIEFRENGEDEIWIEGMLFWMEHSLRKFKLQTNYKSLDSYSLKHFGDNCLQLSLRDLTYNILRWPMLKSQQNYKWQKLILIEIKYENASTKFKDKNIFWIIYGKCWMSPRLFNVRNRLNSKDEDSATEIEAEQTEGTDNLYVLKIYRITFLWHSNRDQNDKEILKAEYTCLKHGAKFPENYVCEPCAKNLRQW